MADCKIWLPLYPGDFLAETQSFSCEQRGAFVLLLISQWRTGYVPADPNRLAAICGVTRTKWVRHLAPAILPLFEERGDRLVHLHLERERNRAQKIGKTQQIQDKKPSGNGEKTGENAPPISNEDNGLAAPLARVGARAPSPSPSESKIPKTSSSGAPATPDAVDQMGDPLLSARDIMWRHGPAMVTFLTGKSNAQARSLLGKMLVQARDDCSEVMRILEHARSLHPLAGAEAYLLSCAKQRGPGARTERAGGRTSSVAWMADLPGFGGNSETSIDPSIPDLEMKAEDVA